MTLSLNLQLADHLVARIEDVRADGGLAINDFRARRAFTVDHEAADDRGEILVLPASGFTGRRSRGGSANAEITCLVWIVAGVGAGNEERVAKLVTLIESLGDVCRGAAAAIRAAGDAFPFEWSRNEDVRDPNNVPFSIEHLRSDASFRGGLTTTFTTELQPSSV